MKNSTTSLQEVPLPFAKGTLRIALVQLAGPAGGKITAFVTARETFVWASEEEVLQRRRKAQRILQHIADQYPETDLIIFPEYSLPVETLLGDLQRYADDHNTVIIGGSDNIRRGHSKIYNECPVVIPHRAEPVWIHKRELSQWELTKVDAWRGAANPIFTWHHGSQQYWFSVHICLDFLNVLSEPVYQLIRPGFLVAPMCSPDITTMRTYSDSILRAESGRACLLCNAHDTLAVGNSSVMAVTPTGKALEPAIEVPREGEHLLVFELNCDSLAPPRKSPLHTRSPLPRPWHLERVVQSTLGYDFRPLKQHALPPSIGIVNPEVYELRGLKMRLAFLRVNNYTDVVEQNAERDFEILAVLGQDDILVSHLAATQYDLAFDLRPIGASAGTAPGIDQQEKGAAEGIPFFEVDTYFKVLGKEVTEEDRQTFRRGMPDPTSEEFRILFAMAENWDSTEISADDKRLFLERRWILAETRRVPGDINAIMNITLDEARQQAQIFDVFEREVLPAIVRRSEVTTVYGGSGRRMHVDYVLRVTTDLQGLYPIIDFVHRLASQHRLMITTTTYVVVHKIASLSLANACNRSAPNRSHYLNYHLWNRLDSLERRHFQELPEERQGAIIRLFERAERALLELANSTAGGEGSKHRNLELIASALVSDKLEIFSEGFARIHAALERKLDEIMAPIVDAGHFAKLAAEIDLPHGKTLNKLTYAEKIRMLKRAAASSLSSVNELTLDALARTTETRNAFVHQRIGELTADALVATVEAYSDLFNESAR